MKGICPNCEQERSLQKIVREETFNIRGERIEVEVHILRCLECGEEIDDLQSSYDPIAEAYRTYRNKKGMIQPEEIRVFRKKYNLSQRELNELLGWGGATSSRYENGALQSDAHDQLLRLAMKPDNLLELINANSQALDNGKRRNVIEKLGREDLTRIWSDLCVQILGSDEPDIYSGYKKLDLEKFIQMILYFCIGEGVLKTKLNKLLFYADFLYFKYYTVSISGARYAKLPFGPVPDKYNLIYAGAIDELKVINVDERPVHTYMGEYFVAQVFPKLSIFNASELKILATVKEHFEKYGSKEISEFSHKERAYFETQNTRLIPYTYAEHINLD